MPLPTPFHERTREQCLSYKYKDWSGYYAVCAYGLSPEREYNAIRQGAGLLDVTPLFKYDVSGAGAAAFLSRVMAKDIAALRPGRMTYLCWCDDDGKVIDDGTCANLGDGRYRVTASAPALHWLLLHSRPFDVAVLDVSSKLGALALQGPTSRALLAEACDADLTALSFFGITETRFGGHISGWLSRTGYTGDLGYELWVDSQQALALWDLLMEAGKKHHIEPVGLDALDIARIESGFILRGVDYIGANVALTPAQKSSPFELGLGWTVHLGEDREPFIGQAALQAEKRRGSPWAMVGLCIDWPAVEALFAEQGLAPEVPSAAWRGGIPIYHEGRQVGRATSGTWSPILKQNLALGTVAAALSAPGTTLYIEQTVHFARHTVPAIVTATPFFDPPRKRR